jgi:hypothetical protein
MCQVKDLLLHAAATVRQHLNSHQPQRACLAYLRRTVDTRDCSLLLEQGLFALALAF